MTDEPDITWEVRIGFAASPTEDEQHALAAASPGVMVYDAEERFVEMDMYISGAGSAPDAITQALRQAPMIPPTTDMSVLARRRSQEELIRAFERLAARKLGTVYVP